MRILVSDLLLLSRADTDETVFHKTHLSLSSLMAEIVMTYDAAIHKKGIALKTLIEKEAMIQGDKDRISQLLMILLDNAVIYNKDDGSLCISLSTNAKDTVIRISDTGEGIQPEEMDKIFNRFYRGHQSRQKNPDGSGLGLVIAKMIVEKHSGTIIAKSQPDEWSEFTVRFPISYPIS